MSLIFSALSSTLEKLVSLAFQCLIQAWLCVKKSFTAAFSQREMDIDSQALACSVVDDSFSSTDYEVFISHRGNDIQNILGAHICDLLELHGIHAFLSPEKIGITTEEFPDKIRDQAIQSASIHVAILCKHYAESPRCLSELTAMFKTKNEIIPLYYDVAPSGIRQPEGIYAKDFEKHGKRFNQETVDEWRKTICKVSKLPGFELGDFEWGLAKFVVDTVLLRKLNNGPLHVARFPVGLEERVVQLREQILEHRRKTDRLMMVGIVGMAGIGKSTLAKALYNAIRLEFGASIFIDNFKGANGENKLLDVRRMVATHKHYQGVLRTSLEDQISSIDRLMGSDVSLEDQISSIDRLMGSDVLIVVDSVDCCAVLMDALRLEHDSLRNITIIVTTRDRRAVKQWTNLGMIYELDELNSLQSKELFCWHAFHMNNCHEEPFQNMVEKFVDRFRGFPLALRVCGGQVYGESYENWDGILGKVSETMPTDIKRILKESYNQMEETEKQIFLDVAVFLNGEDKQTISRIHDITILVEKCVVKLERNRLRMHHLLCQLGKEIVDEECLNEPGRRSRLWRPSDVREVLRNWTGTNSVRGLSLVSKRSVIWNKNNFGERCAWPTDSLSEMTDLQLLVLEGDCLKGDFSCVSKQLRWLRWWHCPYNCIPPNLQTVNLKVLDLRGGKFTLLWHEESQIPGTLEELNLQRCCFLESLPYSIGNLTRLKKINLSECKLLRQIPDTICLLRALEHLNLGGCSNLVHLPKLGIDSSRLEYLNLSYCYNLKHLELCMPRLKFLHIEGCERIESGGDSFVYRQLPNLEDRESSRESAASLKLIIGIRELPAFIQEMYALECLRLSGLKRLREIPSFIGELFRLEELSVSNCPRLAQLPESLGKFGRLKTLELRNCRTFNCISTFTLLNLRYLENLSIIDCRAACLPMYPLQHLVKLKELRVTSTPSSVSTVDFPHEVWMPLLRNLEVLEIDGWLRLNAIDLLQQNNLRHLQVFLDDEHLRRAITVRELQIIRPWSSWRSPFIPVVNFVARAIPFPRTGPDSTFGFSYFPMRNTSDGLGLELKMTGISNRDTALIVCFVSALLPDKFDNKRGLPQAQIKLYYDGHMKICYSQTKLGEWINFGILSTDNSSILKDARSRDVLVRLAATSDNESDVVRLKHGWMQMVTQGEEHRIPQICDSFFQELIRQRPLSIARSQAPSQLNIRNLQALEIANCNIRRIRQLGNTPLEEEELDLQCTKTFAFGTDYRRLNHLDLCIITKRCRSLILHSVSRANFYKLQVTIQCRGVQVYTDELRELLNDEYDEDTRLPNFIKCTEQFRDNELQELLKRHDDDVLHLYSVQNPSIGEDSQQFKDDKGKGETKDWFEESIAIVGKEPEQFKDDKGEGEIKDWLEEDIQRPCAGEDPAQFQDDKKKGRTRNWSWAYKDIEEGPEQLEDDKRKGEIKRWFEKSISHGYPPPIKDRWEELYTERKFMAPKDI